MRQAKLRAERGHVSTSDKWSRELVLYLTRKRNGLTLQEIVKALGIREYKTVSRAVQRFESSLPSQRVKRQMVKECINELSQVEM